MGVNVSNEFHRTSANPIDDSLVLSSAEMLAMNDNLMPEKYFAVSKTDGCLYLYDKSATPNQTTGKFTKFEGGSTYTLPKATNNALGGIMTGYTPTANSTELPVQVNANGQAFVVPPAQVVDGFTGKLIKRYAVCTTGASSSIKVVTIAAANGTFQLTEGVILVIKFKYANKATSNPQLRVDTSSTTGTAKSIYYNGKLVSTTNNNTDILKDILTFIYDGSNFNIIGGETPKVDVDGVSGNKINRYAVCDTAAATAAKTASPQMGTFVLESGAKITVNFTIANTATDAPTLNIDDTGAKNIYYNGTQITAANGYLLKGIITFVYDGTKYQIISGVQPMVDGVFGNVINRYANCTCDSSTNALYVSRGINYGTFNLVNGAIVIVRFTNNYTYTGNNAPTLNVDSTGAKDIYYNGSQVTTTSVPSAADIFKQNVTITFVCRKEGTYYKYEIIGGVEGEKYELPVATSSNLGGIQVGYEYDSTKYPSRYGVYVDNSNNAYVDVPAVSVDGFTGNTIKRFVTCGTAAATATKVVTIADANGAFTLEVGTILVVKFNYENTATSAPKLQVDTSSATGIAKNIYYNGSQVTADNGYLLKGIITFLYDGTQYQIIGRSAIQSVDGFTGDTIKRYATCTTAASTMPKVVTFDDATNGHVSLTEGTIVVVKFTYANTSTTTPQLTVETDGTASPKNIYINGSQMTGDVGLVALRGIVTFVYDGSSFHLISDVMPSVDGIKNNIIKRYTTCTTSASTAAKKAAVISGFTLEAGAILVVKFNNANTATSNPTLQVGATGTAKNIYYDGSQVTAANGYLIKGILTFLYDGTNYNIIGGVQPTIDGVFGDTINRYAVCSTVASSEIKSVAITNGKFVLKAGATVFVKFEETFTSTNDPMLNVNNTGAKPIFYNGTQILAAKASSILLTNKYYQFVYDATNDVYEVLTDTIDVATTTVLGGIKIGYNEPSSSTNRNYAIQLDSSGNAFVTVPWTVSSGGSSYSIVSKQEAGLCPQLPDETLTNKYLCQDGNWAVPYTHPTTAGNRHIPSGGEAGKILGYGGSSGTAEWIDQYSYTLPAATSNDLGGVIIGSNINNNNGVISVEQMVGATSENDGTTGLVPTPPSNGYNTKFLRADGTWAVPSSTPVQQLSLSDSINDGTSDSSGTVAATPKAVHDLHNILDTAFSGIGLPSIYFAVSDDSPFISWGSTIEVSQWITGDSETQFNVGDILVIRFDKPMECSSSDDRYADLIIRANYQLAIPTYSYLYNDIKKSYIDGRYFSYGAVPEGSIVTYRITSNTYIGGEPILAVVSTTYNGNVANATNKGFVKLTDTIDNTLDVDDGIAVTPKAVYDYVQQAIAQALGNN